MGFYYRRRVKLGRRTWANVSKHGVSVSHRHEGPHGTAVTFNTRRRFWVKIARGFGYRGSVR